MSPVGSPDPADAGSGEVVAAASVEPKATFPLPSGTIGPGTSDRVFRGLSEGSGVVIVVLIAAIGVFLVMRATPALARDKENFSGKLLSAMRHQFGGHVEPKTAG